MLEAQTLCVSYPIHNDGSREVLHGVSLKLEPGSILGLIGPNGAGKSTLVRSLSGVVPLQSGRVLVNGQPLSSLKPNQRARWVAVVPQARNLPPAFTGWETVALGRTPYLNWLGQLSSQDEAHIRQVMERTNTLELADRPVGEMSGGEQQRLLIARALAQAAPILLLDEPTAHLDLQYQYGLLDLVHDLAHKDGLAVLLALHDLNLVARYADRVALLVGGRLQALGAPAEVLNAQQLSLAYHIPLEVISPGATTPLFVIPARK
jgi:iron complex transport system ATP-binding protein